MDAQDNEQTSERPRYEGYPYPPLFLVDRDLDEWITGIDAYARTMRDYEPLSNTALFLLEKLGALHGVEARIAACSDDDPHLRDHRERRKALVAEMQLLRIEGWGIEQAVDLGAHERSHQLRQAQAAEKRKMNTKAAVLTVAWRNIKARPDIELAQLRSKIKQRLRIDARTLDDHLTQEDFDLLREKARI